MTNPEVKIAVALDGDDGLVCIQPPVDNAFREVIYDELDALGLIKEIVVRDGSFFDLRHSKDGSPYSELRISNTALVVAGQKIIDIAHMSAEVLEGQGIKSEVDPYLKAVGSNKKLFEQ